LSLPRPRAADRMRHAAEDLLTSLPRLLRRKAIHLPKDYAAIASEPDIVRSRAARLYPHHEA
jgi:hypothetical protein